MDSSTRHRFIESPGSVSTPLPVHARPDRSDQGVAPHIWAPVENGAVHRDEESRYVLAARNGVNLGPWQINVAAHPWVTARRLTSSWTYSAKVAYRISDHGTDWSPWTTHSLCGV